LTSAPPFGVRHLARFALTQSCAQALLPGEVAAGPAVPLAGGGGALWRLPLVGGGAVAFALVSSPARAARVAGVGAGSSLGAARLESGGQSGSGSAAARLFVATVEAGPGATAAARLFEVAGGGGAVAEVEAAGAVAFSAASHGTFGGCFPHVVYKRDG
jgi:hypothetical protein